jgi:SAM-dependent methyltransferase
LKTLTDRPGDQSIQAAEYAFPYHYIPQATGRLLLSRHWDFAASYVAALNIVAEHLRPLAEAEGAQWRHIDIGCGDGALVHHLSRLQGFAQGRIAGVDIDARAIEWARMFNPGAELVTGDMATLEGGYASATLIEVLEHVPPRDLPAFVASSARLLRPGGRMVVTVPSVEKPVARKHFQDFSFQSIREALAPSFDRIEIFGFERRDRLTRLIDRTRSNRIFHLDSPALNARAVARLQRTHLEQHKCGRLLAVCQRRSD